MNDIERKKIGIVIPARLGSNRVKLKNLRLLDGKPLITYVIDSCIKSKLSNNIYVNSDSSLFKKVCDEKKINFYLRPKLLATSKSLIDDYIYEFICKTNYEYLVLVNPTSPFLKPDTIIAAFKFFKSNNFDSLIACEKIQTHCFYKNNAINFEKKGQHPRSQDLEPIMALNFAVSIWDTHEFKKNYDNHKYGVYTGKLGLFPINDNEAIDIDYEEDFALAEYVMKSKDHQSKIEYPDYVNAFLNNNSNIQN
jgi:CMP-N-acetylneuraminic acid synthetase